MRLGFLENRYKTYFWQKLAEEFESNGHPSSWLVQNPAFLLPNLARPVTVRFPRSEELIARHQWPMATEKLIGEHVESDRNINYFGGGPEHYPYYLRAIEDWLDSWRPDAVIGESTLFHELLTISACKARGIPYYHPSMPGYPGGRFSIYSYDTKDALANPNAEVEDSFLAELISSIVERRRVPEYMKLPSAEDAGRSFPLPGSFRDKLRIASSYYRGERFNTPSPFSKYFLGRNLKARVQEWDKLSQSQVQNLAGQKLLLYPMQMQPEANLDVWGRKFRNQAAFVNEMASILPDGWCIAVKLNPKSKYELDDEVIAVASQRTNVVALHSTTKMSSIFDRASLVVTVTGTIAVESYFSGKPLVCFGPTILPIGSGCVRAECIADLTSVIEQIQTGTFAPADNESKLSAARLLFSTSYEGYVSDPASLPSVMDGSNVKSVCRAILTAIGAVAAH